MVQYFTATRLKSTPKNELHIFIRGFAINACLFSCRFSFFFSFFLSLNDIKVLRLLK